MTNKLFTKKNLKFFVYSLIAICGILYIVLGNSYYKNKVAINKGVKGDCYKGEIVEVGESTVDENIGWVTIKVKIKFLNGNLKGNIVDSELVQDGMFNKLTRKVEEGDKYIVYKQYVEGVQYWGLGEPIKTTKLSYLLGIFFIGLIILGGLNGVKTIVSLSATCLGIFMVFIPSIMAGANIYLSTIIVSAFIIFVTLPIVIGINKKCLASIIGCLGGVLISGIVTVVMTNFLNLSGMVNEESVYITYINPDINLKAIVFASILIGSLGATMDIAISIASSIKEIANEVKDVSRKKLILSGLNIGKDIMGTMTNTLILAYIGSSLSMAILLIAYNTSIYEALNKERMVVEILQSLTGSLGMLLTIPITAVVSSALYIKKKTNSEKNINS